MVTTDITLGVATTSSDSLPASKGLTCADRTRLSPQSWEYATAGFILLRKAQDCRNRNELQEACLYGWGAAEEITRAVAENWKDYGVERSDERDLKTLVYGILLFDSEMMRSVAAICDGEGSSDEKQQEIGKLVRNRSKSELESELDWLFHEAEDLREGFYDDDTAELYIDRGLKSVALYIAKMLPWLRQPHPPQGFRQYQWQEPFTLPNAERTE